MTTNSAAPSLADEVRVKDLFETIAEVDEATCKRGVTAAAALEKLLDSVKRGLINPKGVEGASLLRAVATFEAVFGAIPDPERDK